MVCQRRQVRNDDNEQVGFLGEEGDGRDRGLPHSSDEDWWEGLAGVTCEGFVL